jgi:hypothetical protein
MQATLDLILNEPLYLGVAAVILVLFVVGLIKKLITLAVIAALLAGGYGYWVHGEAAKALHNRGSDLIEQIGGEAGSLLEQSQDTLNKHTK